MSGSVSCFYVISAYPLSYNSDHTNNTYVFVVLETSLGFLMKVINVFLKFLQASKVSLTLLSIKFFTEH